MRFKDLSNSPMKDTKEDPEADLDLGEHQVDHDIKDIESGASDNNFGLNEEPGDEFDLNYESI